VIEPATVFVDSTLESHAQGISSSGMSIPVRTEWLVNGLTVHDGDTFEGEGELVVGDQIQVVVRVTDGSHMASSTSALVVVENRTPTLSNVNLSPSPLLPGEVATCTWDYDDPDGHEDQSVPQWTVDGAPVARGASWQVDATLGSVIGCEVTPADGYDTGESAADEAQLVGGNILIVVADDLGTDKVRIYGEHVDTPNTPVIDDLARSGVMFRNAYSAPVCSPTRAMLQTGQPVHQTGIGNPMDVLNDPFPLDPDLPALPGLLDESRGRYHHAVVGKWHLGVHEANGQFHHPLDMGYAYHAGPSGNFVHNGVDGKPQTYWDYEKSVQGIVERHDVYATTDTVDEAIGQIEATIGPWMVVVAFNAPHTPFHRAPSHLHSMEGVDGSVDEYSSMVEAMDTEIGRLLEVVDMSVTTVLFMGDNGTPKYAVSEPWPRERAKGKVYEGGVRVPLIVAGAWVPELGLTSEALVSIQDVFATVGELAGVDALTVAPDADAMSLVPLFRDPQGATGRDIIQAWKFTPSGPIQPPREYEELKEMARDSRFKLIRHLNEPDELYDLRGVWFEGEDLLSNGEPLSVDAEDAYQRLTDDLNKVPW